MLDKIKAKGDIPSYYLYSHCVLEHTAKDRFTGGHVIYVKIPNGNKTEYLDVRILEKTEINNIRIEGNLRKWIYGSKSAVGDLNYTDYTYCIKLIAKRLGVEEKYIWNLEITYLEMGGNIKLPRCYERFIPGLFSYPELTIERWTESTVYFTGEKYRLIFYDKLKELRDRNVISRKVANKLINKFFILRFEIKVNAKSGYRKKDCIHSFGSIRDNWDLLINDWFTAFEKAKIVDLFSDSVEVKKGSLAKRETFDYGNFLLINSIGLDRGLYHYQYFMKNRKSEAVEYIQYLFKKYKTGGKWKFYENTLIEANLKKEDMKERIDRPHYNKKKTTTKSV